MVDLRAGRKLDGFVELVSELRFRIVNRDRVEAHRVLDQFIDNIGSETFTLEAGTSLADVAGLPERLVNSLQDAGYMTAGSLKYATEEDIAAIPNVGPRYIEVIRQTLPQFAPKRRSDQDAIPELPANRRLKRKVVSDGVEDCQAAERQAG